jgi:HEPN domain-containing protein
MDPKQELVDSWMEKAKRDYASAVKLASGPDPYYDTALYHCQQAAEKALKAWFVQSDLRFEKVHDLGALISLAEKRHPGFAELYEPAELLMPYASLYRYPGTAQKPDRKEFEQSLQAAEFILDFVQQVL